jgi:hypothetical protein
MTEFAPCPKCNNSAAERLKFTWWGGALGPKILTHVKCGACGMKYNGKTGRDNTTGIVVYSIIAGVVSFVLLFIVVFAFAVLSR